MSVPEASSDKSKNKKIEGQKRRANGSTTTLEDVRQIRIDKVKLLCEIGNNRILPGLPEIVSVDLTLMIWGSGELAS